MSNPWLAVPLEDYEGHMGADNVRQLEALSYLFNRTLELCVPESVAVLGVAGGNGLERIDPRITKRVVGLDIHPRYLEAVQKRYGSLPGLELHCVDLAGEPAGDPLDIAPVALVHAALVFEHAGLGRSLQNALSLVAPGGRLSVVMQLPSDTEHGVSPTRYASMQTLRDAFALIDVPRFCGTLHEKGFDRIEQEEMSLPAGKAFWLGIFTRRAAG